MADMKMKRNGEGGYLLTLTQGQMKKWPTLKMEINTTGLIPSKKWEDMECEVGIAADTYILKVNQAQSEKRYTVTLTSKTDKDRTLSKSYRTWECRDNMMRMLLELHHSYNEQKKQERLAKNKAQLAKKQA